MPRFRKKPVEVEAEQYTEEQFRTRENLPKGVSYSAEQDDYYVTTIHNQRVYLQPGDWILPEPDGIHYYPVKDEIFRNTYEPVTDNETASAAISKVIEVIDKETT